jgi:hypothetical protein
MPRQESLMTQSAYLLFLSYSHDCASPTAEIFWRDIDSSRQWYR